MTDLKTTDTELRALARETAERCVPALILKGPIVGEAEARRVTEGITKLLTGEIESALSSLSKEKAELLEIVKLAVAAYEDPGIWLDDARRAIDASRQPAVLPDQEKQT